MPEARDVFDLRRNGQSEEAYALAKSLYSTEPDSIWSVRALGWSIHDCLKLAMKSGNTARLKALHEEFTALPISQEEGDASLRAAREDWAEKLALTPEGSTLREALDVATSLSKDGIHEDAIRNLRSLLAGSPESKSIQLTFAWAIERALKALRLEKDREISKVQRLVAVYQSLDKVDRPSLIHSLILRRVAQCQGYERQFVTFFRWWNSINFQKEDFNRYELKETGRSFDSLAELVIKTAYRSVKESQDKAQIQWVQQFVGEHMHRFPHQEWFGYYYGKLLVWSGELLKAREYILPILRRKQTEFWAWDCLASTYGEEEEGTRMALLARALLCQTQDPSYLITVRQSFGELLIAQGMLPEASVEIHEVVGQREAKGWKLSEQLLTWKNADWFLDPSRPKDNHALYRSLAATAEDVLNQGLPEHLGVFARHLENQPGGQPRSIISVKEGEGTKDLRVTTGRFPILKSLERGAPLFVRVSEVGSRLEVVSLRSRDGEPWDLVPAMVGLVQSHNIEKGFTVIALADEASVLYYHDTFPEILHTALGQAISVRFTSEKETERKRSLTWKQFDKEPGDGFWGDFEGSVSTVADKPFGFVAHVFISPELMESLVLKHGDRVRVRAVVAFNPKRNEHGVRAVRVQRI